MLRWLVPALAPALALLALVYFSDRRREPWFTVLGTFILGGAFGYGAFYAEERAAAWTGLDVRADVAGNAGALLFLFAFVAPVREAVKVCATWPAFRSKYFDEPLDGVVYSSASALGFACVQNAWMFRAHEFAGIWIARAALALLANVFFAWTWGYALGRVKQRKEPGRIFGVAWLGAVLVHGLYSHLVHGRGPGAIVGVVPLIFAMAIVAYFGWRDLKSRGDAAAPESSPLSSSRLERPSIVASVAPPSLRSVREAMRKAGQPVTLR